MTREIKIEEVKQHNNEKSVWMIIHNEVYDVTKFLNEHPGGADSLLDYAGEDGTQAFEDVGHSDDAREMMEQYKIGTLPADQRIVAPGPPPSSGSNLKWALFALAGAIVIGIAMKKYLS